MSKQANIAAIYSERDCCEDGHRREMEGFRMAVLTEDLTEFVIFILSNQDGEAYVPSLTAQGIIDSLDDLSRDSAVAVLRVVGASVDTRIYTSREFIKADASGAFSS